MYVFSYLRHLTLLMFLWIFIYIDAITIYIQPRRLLVWHRNNFLGVTSTEDQTHRALGTYTHQAWHVRCEILKKCVVNLLAHTYLENGKEKLRMKNEELRSSNRLNIWRFSDKRNPPQIKGRNSKIKWCKTSLCSAHVGITKLPTLHLVGKKSSLENELSLRLLFYNYRVMMRLFKKNKIHTNASNDVIR